MPPGPRPRERVCPRVDACPSLVFPRNEGIRSPRSGRDGSGPSWLPSATGDAAPPLLAALPDGRSRVSISSPAVRLQGDHSESAPRRRRSSQRERKETRMRKLSAWEYVTLDGVVEAP